jgi:hypothetical protein
MRLSINSLAGTARTLVAVGTARLASMLEAVRAATPRNRTSSAPAGTGGGAGFLAAGLESALESALSGLASAFEAGLAAGGWVWGALAGWAAAVGGCAVGGAAVPLAVWFGPGEAVVAAGRESGW